MHKIDVDASGTNQKSILFDYREISLDDVKKAALKDGVIKPRLLSLLSQQSRK